jgi:RHS repeat-associated protein
VSSDRLAGKFVASVGLGTWLAAFVVAAGATFLACGGNPGSRDEAVKLTEALTSSCTFTVTKNEYDGPDMWGTITFRNNGPSTATNYVVEFDVPSGAHCTAEPESVPANATLSPLTTSGNPKQTLGNHCVFTFSNISLASGVSKTFNYSTDSESSTAASNLTVSSAACGGASGGGGSASGLTCNTFSVNQNSYDGPNWWGTIKFTNNGPSTASSYVVEFDVPSGKHCTGEPDAIPPQSSLSPLTYPPPPDPPQTASNHCVFTWTNGTTLLQGESKTFNYSADSQSISAASNLVIRDGACVVGAGGAPDPRGSGSILSTGTDVGTAPGEISVSPRGEVSYTIPLWTPAGRNGMTPNLSLAYGSSSDNPAGLRWSVAGSMSMIHRCSTNSLRADRPNPVKFEATDTLCLDGQPLVLVSGAPGSFGAAYRTEPESLTDIVISQASGGVPIEFTVQTRDGRIHRYGGGDTNLSVTGTVARWSANGSTREASGLFPTQVQVQYGWLRGSTEDKFGNKIWFKYSHPTNRTAPFGEQEPLIDTIEYADVGTVRTRSVKFNYKPRPPEIQNVVGVAGMPFASTKFLESIDMRVVRPGTQTPTSVRFYKLTQEQSVMTKRMLLKQLEECDGNPATVTGRTPICKKATVFSYASDLVNLLEDPAIPLANMRRPEDGDFQGIQTADMDNDGKDDLVYRAHRENAAAGEPPHWFVRLSTGNGFTDPIDLNLTDGNNTQIGDAVIADFVDGDGLPDIAVPVPGTTAGEKAFVFYRNNGVTTAAADFTFITKETTGPNQALEINDFKGKGTPMLLRPTADGRWAYRFFRDNGTGPALTPASDPLNVNWPADFLQSGWSASSADIDGDGAAEFLVSTNGSNRLSVLRQKVIPGGAPTSGDWEIDSVSSTLLKSTSTDPIAHFYLDHNGDGLPDVLRLRKGETMPSLIMNTGAGMEPPGGISVSGVDGDLSNFPKANVKVGSGMKASDLVDPGIRILDFDGDGRDDVLLVDDGAIRDSTANPPPSTVRTNLTVLISRGDGVEIRDLGKKIGDPSEGPIRATSPNVHNYRQTQILDADGDNRPDIVSVFANTVRLLRTGNGQSSAPDILTQVKDGMGKKTTVTYRPSSDRTVVTPGNVCSARPFLYDCSKRRWIVSSMKTDNGLGGNQNEYKYHYNVPVIDKAGGGDLGFVSWQVEDVVSSTTVTESFDLTSQRLVKSLDPNAPDALVYDKVGLPVKRTVETLGTGFQRKRTTDFEYKFVTTVGGKSYFARPKKVTTSEIETHGSSSVEVFNEVLTYFDNANPDVDEYGGPPDSEVKTVDAKGPYTLTTTWAHEKIAGLWPPLKQTSQKITSDSPLGSADRVTDFKVNHQTGALDGLTIQPFVPPATQTDTFLDVSYGRNSKGLVTTTTRTAKAGTRVDTIAYDEQDVHPVQTTNPLGHVTSLDIDEGLGVPLSVTDANNVRTTFDYDAFGRLRRANQPGGGGETLTYARELEPGQATGSDRFVTRIKRVVDGGGESSVLVNRLGQEIQRESKNMDGTTSFVRQTYNELGLISGSTRPALFSSGTPGPETNWFYDELGRVTGRIRPEDGKDASESAVVSAISETTYENLLATEKDDAGRITEYTRDKLGQVIKTEALKSASYRIPTEYTYGPFGQLKIVERKNKAGTVSQKTNYGYDPLNRQISVSDPDAGHRDIFYNGFGELRQVIDGNGKRTTYVPDEIGRVKERQDDDGTTTFTWDTHGKGLLASSKSASSLGDVEKEYFYDSSGRMFRQITRIGGETFQIDTTYDAFGRAKTISYPVGGSGPRFAVRNTFDPDSGELTKVQNDADTSQTYWELKSTKPDGQIRQEALGGTAVISDYGYSDATGRMTSIKSTKSAATMPFRQWSYDYWKDGSLRLRSDIQRNEHERFQYDGLGRLESWQSADRNTGLPVTNAWRVDYSIDDFGNIEHRNFIAGSATGGTSQDAEFTVFPGTNRLKNSPWGPYIYDDNGNQVARPGEGIAYTAFDLPKSILGPVSATFSYDAAGTRVAKKKSATEFTYYVGGLYEKRVNGSTKEHVFYVMGAGGVVAQIKRTEGGSETKSYLLADRLGSIETVTDNNGNRIDAESIKRDPYGNAVPVFNEPRLPDFTGPGMNKIRLGFTGHEQDDELGLINMKGRVFDPRLARFLTPDPLISDPANGQTYNRYAYVRNKPLDLVDPTGFADHFVGQCVPQQSADGETVVICNPPEPRLRRSRNISPVTITNRGGTRSHGTGGGGTAGSGQGKSGSDSKSAPVQPAAPCNLPCAAQAAGANPDASPTSDHQSSNPDADEAQRNALLKARGAVEFATLKMMAKRFDVGTAPNAAVFFSGPTNRGAAQRFMETHRGTTTVDVLLGKSWSGRLWMRLVDSPSPLISSLSERQKNELWDIVSGRFAAAASGEVNAFVVPRRSDSTWDRIEKPALQNNPNVTAINYPIISSTDCGPGK